MRIGYFLSAEESSAKDLVQQARWAEGAGFDALWISDHFHPWNDEQGESPFVWSVIGAIAEAIELPVTTAVTCPTVRIHPAIIAQAAAPGSTRCRSTHPRCTSRPSTRPPSSSRRASPTASSPPSPTPTQ